MANNGLSIWFKKKVVDPLLEILRRGAEPKLLAFSAALGITLGVFPICGTTVILCGMAIASLGSHCHAPTVMLTNVLATPIELSLIVPFLRFGEIISGGAHFPLTSDAFKKVLTGQASREVLLSIAHALLGWLVAAPLIFAALYILFLPCFKVLVPKFSTVPLSPKKALSPTEVRLKNITDTFLTVPFVCINGKMQVSDLDELRNEAYEHVNIYKERTRLYHDTVIHVHLNSSLVDQKTKALGESLGIWFILANSVIETSCAHGKCTSSPSNFLPNSSSEGMTHDLPLVDKAKHISASLVAYGSSRPRSCVVHLPIGAFVAWWLRCLKMLQMTKVSQTACLARPKIPRSSPSGNSWLFPESRSCCLVGEIAVWVRGLPFLECPAYASSHVFKTGQIEDSNCRSWITMASSKKDEISVSFQACCRILGTEMQQFGIEQCEFNTCKTSVLSAGRSSISA
ncbi:unnamed protein product [Prunus brigantina]